VLLFLHADVALPATPSRGSHARWRAGAVAGAFRVRTVADADANRLAAASHRRPPLALHAACRTAIRRSSSAARLRAAGGFPDEPLMEDVAFARRLRRVGRIVTVPAYVRASGRRFPPPAARELRRDVDVPDALSPRRAAADARALYGDPR
jgi:hypothetical protein